MSDIIERACRVMHDAYEAAAVKAGWETQARSRKPWEDVPEANKATMRVAVGAVLPMLRRHIAADIAAGLEDGCCPYCTVGEHALCTRGGCVCWTEAGTHRENGGVG